MEEAQNTMRDWKDKFDQLAFEKNEQDAMDFEIEQRELRDEADAAAVAARALLQTALDDANAEVDRI